MTAHTAVIGMLWRALESYGIDPASIIPNTMYSPGAYIADNSYIRLQDYYEILGKAIDVINDEAFGLTVARLMHPSHLGIFGHAWIASPSVIASCRILERFGRIFFGDLRVELREHPDAIELSYDPHSVSPFPEIDADAQVGGLIKFCRMQYGNSFMPASVTLRRAVPDSRTTWDEYFGVPVAFGAEENLARIDPGIGKKILTTAHTMLFEKHSKALAESSVELESSNLVIHVRLAIQQLLPSGAVAEESVANIVDVNPRTLHRRLSQEGETFGSLLKDVRMDLAKRQLVKDDYSVTEIAFMLGYSDSSAFSRAFKSWFGVSPSEFRSTGTANRRGAVDRGL